MCITCPQCVKRTLCCARPVILYSVHCWLSANMTYFSDGHVSFINLQLNFWNGYDRLPYCIQMVMTLTTVLYTNGYDWLPYCIQMIMTDYHTVYKWLWLWLPYCIQMVVTVTTILYTNGYDFDCRTVYKWLWLWLPYCIQMVMTDYRTVYKWLWLWLTYCIQMVMTVTTLLYTNGFDCDYRTAYK
jgi:hypothetical protein